MAKKENKSFLQKMFQNSYVRTFVAMALISGVLVALVLYGLNIYTKHGETVIVPPVQGLQETEAEAILRKAGLDYEIIDSMYLVGGIPGAVIEQVPEEASKVKKGRTIFLRVQAKNVEMITIPKLRDLSQRQAVATLESLGFKNVAINEISSPYKGLVLEMTHKGKAVEANEKLPKGDPITLTVGAGGQTIMDSIVDYIPDYDPNFVDEEDSQTDNLFLD